jgi:hypothetical protein
VGFFYAQTPSEPRASTSGLTVKLVTVPLRKLMLKKLSADDTDEEWIKNKLLKGRFDVIAK